MNIKLSPINSYNIPSITKQGDCLTINSTPYDFTQLPDGATLPADAIDCEFIVGDVERIDGEIELTLLRPYTEATQENCFPAPLLNAQDGVIL